MSQICPSCQAQNQPGIAYCQSCGGAFPPLPPPPPPICPKCGHPGWPARTFTDSPWVCANCKTIMPTYQQAKAMTLKPPGALNCPRCGGWGKGNYSGCIIAVCIFLFPIGLLSLMAPKSYLCRFCGYTWKA